MYFAALHKYGLWFRSDWGEGLTRSAKKDFLDDATLHIPANRPQSSTHLFDQSWAAPAAYRLLTL